MQVVRKHLVALAAACLLAVLAFGGIPVQEALGAGGGYSLTADVPSSSEYHDDLSETTIVIDVYKIADGTSDSYSFVGDFAADESLTSADWANLSTDADQLKKLSDLASQIALDKGTDASTFFASEAAGKPIELDGEGLYLVLAHQDGVTDSLTAQGKTRGYTFQPSIVAFPNSNAKNGNLSMKLKPETVPTAQPAKPTQSSRNAVKTGDPTDLVPFYIALMASGTLLLILGVNSFRRRGKRG